MWGAGTGPGSARRRRRQARAGAAAGCGPGRVRGARAGRAQGPAARPTSRPATPAQRRPRACSPPRNPSLPPPPPPLRARAPSSESLSESSSDSSSEPSLQRARSRGRSSSPPLPLVGTPVSHAVPLLRASFRPLHPHARRGRHPTLFGMLAAPHLCVSFRPLHPHPPRSQRGPFHTPTFPFSLPPTLHLSPFLPARRIRRRPFLRAPSRGAGGPWARTCSTQKRRESRARFIRSSFSRSALRLQRL